MSKRILVIDDDAAVRRAFDLALRGEPYQLDLASSGEEGVSRVVAQAYDLIYLDLRMPGLDGVETLRRVRRERPDQRVYFVTAFHKEFFEQLVAARAEGLDFELLHKPLERGQIIEITRAILGDGMVIEGHGG